MSGEVEYKLALKLVYEFLERLRVLERNTEHLNNLVHFLSDYYNEYYRKESNCKGGGQSRSGIVYENYKPALGLMREDIKDLQDFCWKLILGIQTYINYKDKSEERKERKDFFEVKQLLFRNILYKGFRGLDTTGEEIKRDKYEEFVRQKTLKDKRIGNVFDIVATLRDLIEVDVSTYTVSLGSLNTALACLSHSIEQSMSGLFVGNLIEHQPSVYTHKDLYHTMYYASLYCEGYNYSMRDLFKGIFGEDEEEKKLFYKVSGIKLQDGSGSGIKYTIVFGDRTLPQLLDRYKLIALPIICAYRPRYWATLAHEVSHSYLHGLICCREIKEELLHSEMGETIENSEKERRTSEYEKIAEALEYCADMIASDPYIGKAFVRRLSTRVKKREIYFAGASTEIMADVFGFLLGGYAYIPALISNIALGRPDVIPTQKLPYALRVGVVLAIAGKFTYDKLKLKGTSKLKKPIEVLKERVDKMAKEMEHKSSVCKKVCDDFNKNLNEVDDFLKAYRNLLAKCLRSEKPRGFMYLDYIFTFGIDLGKMLYDRCVGEILKFILEKNLCFGWIPSDNPKSKEEIKHVALNLLLNNNTFERFKEVKTRSTQKLDEVLCLSNETIELYKQMKLVNWEAEKI